MKSLLPRAAALDVVAAVVSDRKLAAQLLDYWLRKRQAEGGPLIPHLWFEQPWKVRRNQPVLSGPQGCTEAVVSVNTCSWLALQLN